MKKHKDISVDLNEAYKNAKKNDLIAKATKALQKEASECLIDEYLVKRGKVWSKLKELL